VLIAVGVNFLSSPFDTFFVAAGLISLFCGDYLWARAKHRSWGWTFLGLLGPLGLIGLALLQPKAGTTKELTPTSPAQPPS
jgi:hypothetical protein